MSAESTMRAGRALAERLMTDTAVVFGEPTRGPLNEDTGHYDTVPNQIYAGACKVKATNTLNEEVDAQAQNLVIQRLTVAFPITDDTVFAADTTLTITASATDSALVGRTFRITGPHSQTYATARRYPVEETT